MKGTGFGVQKTHLQFQMGEQVFLTSRLDTRLTERYVNRSHEQLVSILNKWSTKVQAATMLQAGNNKFSNAGQVGVVEAIETGLAAKVSSGAI
jgi:hypothetical protein